MTAPLRPATPRLDSLTGVRFLAALLVFGFHGIHYAGDALSAFGAGMVGVSLFYVLSGFVMSWTASPDDETRLFYRRRFARIYPSYVVAWVISLALGAVLGTVSLWDVLLPPTLLQAWVPLRIVYFAGSAVFWSLSCEAFFYLVFPWLHRMLVDRAGRSLVFVGVAATAVSMGTAIAFLGAPEGDVTRWFLVIFPPLRLMEFVIGVVVGIGFRRGLRVPVPVSVALVVAAVACLVAAYAPYSLSRYAVTLIPFVLLVASLASADIRGARSFLRWRPFVELGVWSYCFYLIHASVLIVVFSAAGWFDLIDASRSNVAIALALVVALGLSIACAWLLHRAVERPFEKKLRPAKAARLDDDA